MFPCFRVIYSQLSFIKTPLYPLGYFRWDHYTLPEYLPEVFFCCIFFLLGLDVDCVIFNINGIDMTVEEVVTKNNFQIVIKIYIAMYSSRKSTKNIQCHRMSASYRIFVVGISNLTNYQKITNRQKFIYGNVKFTNTDNTNKYGETITA